MTDGFLRLAQAEDMGTIHGGCMNRAQKIPWRVYEQGTEHFMEDV